MIDLMLRAVVRPCLAWWRRRRASRRTRPGPAPMRVVTWQRGAYTVRQGTGR